MPVEWIVPSRTRVGESLPVRLVITGEKGTKVDGATLTLRGEARFPKHGEGQGSAVLFERTIPLHAEGTTTLLEDPAELTALFEIPEDAGTSFEEKTAEVAVEWKLTLAVSIPWRFDIGEERVVVIEPRESESAGERESEEWRAIVGFQSGLRVEMLLDDHRLAPGEEVRGRIALFNTRGRAIYNFDVVSAFIVAHVRSQTKMSQALRRQPALALRGNVTEGAEHEFVLRIPAFAAVATKCRSDHYELRMFWAARIEIEHEGGSDRTDVELEVGPYVPRTKPLPRATKLAIGRPRWREVLESVAERNGGLTVDADELVATGVVEGVSIALRLDGAVLAAAALSFDPEGAAAHVDTVRTALLESDRVEKSGGGVSIERDIPIGHSVDRLEAFLVDIRRALVSCSLLARE
jgi:hypothetical protein